MEQSMKLLAIVTNVELAQAKASGNYPMARFTFLRATEPDVNGAKRIYYAEIVSNPEAGWVTKGSAGEYIEPEDLEDMKHIVWGAVEVYQQKKQAVQQHGLHLFDVDLDKTPERVIGGIASWCTDPKFVKYAPAEGWAEITARNVGMGNVRYLVSGVLSDGQATKYDYEDMMIAGVANFRLFIPPFLDTPKVYEDGTVTSTWMATVVDALSVEREVSIAKSNEHLFRFQKNQQTYERVVRGEAAGRTTSDEQLIVSGMDGGEINVAELPMGTALHVYGKYMGSQMLLTTIPWNGSERAKARVRENRQYAFSLTIL